MLSRKVTAAAPARLSTWRVSAPSCRAAPRPRRQPVLVAALHGHKRDEEEGVASQETFFLVTNLLMAAIIIGSGARFYVTALEVRGDLKELRANFDRLGAKIDKNFDRLGAIFDSLGAKIDEKFDALMQQEQQAAARRRDAARE